MSGHVSLSRNSMETRDLPEVFLFHICLGLRELPHRTSRIGLDEVLQHADLLQVRVHNRRIASVHCLLSKAPGILECMRPVRLGSNIE